MFLPSAKFTWTATGIYHDTLQSVHGCDSVLIIKLKVNSASHDTVEAEACKRYASPSGRYLWSNTGTYYDTIPNAAGCDSMIRIDLTIKTVDTAVTDSANKLSAVQAGAQYQWLDCGANFAVLAGDTMQTYVATSNGNYAVEIWYDGCMDTSGCHAVTSLGINPDLVTNSVRVYPNPTENRITMMQDLR